MKITTLILAMVAGAVMWTGFVVTVLHFIPDSTELPAVHSGQRATLRV